MIRNLDKKKDKIQNKKISKLPKFLVKPPFRWILCGPSGKGKSNMLCHLFEKPFYGKFWKPDHIIVFSKTLGMDDKICKIPASPANFYKEYSNEVVQHIMDEQEGIKKHYGAKNLDHVLIILDDMMNTNAFSQASLITKNIQIFRHFNISIIVTCQKFSGISRNMRLNSNAYSIFEPNNENEFDHLLDELSNKFNRKKMYEMMKKLFEEPYQFFQIDFTKQKKERYKKGFLEPLQL